MASSCFRKQIWRSNLHAWQTQPAFLNMFDDVGFQILVFNAHSTERAPVTGLLLAPRRLVEAEALVSFFRSCQHCKQRPQIASLIQVPNLSKMSSTKSSTVFKRVSAAKLHLSAFSIHFAGGTVAVPGKSGARGNYQSFHHLFLPRKSSKFNPLRIGDLSQSSEKWGRQFSSFCPAKGRRISRT